MAKKEAPKATITFIGGEETGNVGSVDWGGYKFPLNKAVECTDPHIIRKAMTNRFFKVEGVAGAEVAIPENWEKLSAKDKVALAKELGDEASTTAKDAEATIKAEIERRGEVKAA